MNKELKSFWNIFFDFNWKYCIRYYSHNETLFREGVGGLNARVKRRSTLDSNLGTTDNNDDMKTVDEFPPVLTKTKEAKQTNHLQTMTLAKTHDIPKGRWRDDLCGCCNNGPVCCMTWCCLPGKLTYVDIL